MEKIDNKLFGFHICPRFGKVYAEIYYKHTDTNIETLVQNKDFGRFWRKPIEADYIEAKNWAKTQIEYIKNANN